MKELDVKNK
jgi:hypothetical protein